MQPPKHIFEIGIFVKWYCILYKKWPSITSLTETFFHVLAHRNPSLLVHYEYFFFEKNTLYLVVQKVDRPGR